MEPARLNLFSIPAHLPFADTLADVLMAEAGHDPALLARHLILLPNRRAARALREAFLRQGGGRPMLLPVMRAVDAADEDELTLTGLDSVHIPPAMAELERRLTLARLVAAGRDASPDQILRLADELGRLLDSLTIEGIDPKRLETLVDGDLARHWQETVQFLSIVLDVWPKVLAERGEIDPQDRVNRLLDAQAKLWKTHPPPGKVIAAGSTGTRPATQKLLAVVAGLANGRVILPGLDRDMDDESWAKLDEVHPQFGMKRLLDHFGVARNQVALLPQTTASAQTPRSLLLATVMRPAATTDAWRNPPALDDAAVAGIMRLDLPTPREEAGAIALILRHALETEGRTAALVTTDRTLAKRVRAELGRWGLSIDDSAGEPALTSRPGAFLMLLARAVQDRLAPHPLLALLGHPLAAAGLDPQTFRLLARRIDKDCLRGPRPDPGLSGLRATTTDAALRDFIDRLDRVLGPMITCFAKPKASFRDLLLSFLETAEALASTHREPGALRLWSGEAGETLAQFAADLAEAAAAQPDLEPSRFPALFEVLAGPLTVRPRWGSHPRLFLWGPMESRLQRADVMVLAGLNEGTWPAEPPPDPWTSRPMRQKLGLPSPERRIGQSAHDFVQALGAPTVYLTRALRVDGSPTTPSRWLLRFDAVLKSTGLTLPQPEGDWARWAEALDRPTRVVIPAPPAPRPPLEDRPRELPVTAIETWMRDPYGLYARRILCLTALKPVDEDPGAAEYGTLVHKALEKFFRLHPGPLPANPLDVLLEQGRAVFADSMTRPGVWAFWWPRFESVARWVVAREHQQRSSIVRTLCEIKGQWTITTERGHPFTVTAKADRLDHLSDGTLTIIDYKTGTPPPEREVLAGYAPQLPLETAIAMKGGFEGVPPARIAQMLFWHLKGGGEGGVEKPASKTPEQTASAALDGLRALASVFDNPSTPYEARPTPGMEPRYSDYVHLARVAEWSLGGDGAED